MATVIRRADLETDRGLLIDAIGRWLAPGADGGRRFDWLYRQGPHGPAQVWIAKDEDGSLIGAAAAFPRRMYTEGVIKTGCVLGDFFVTPEYRSLGPAVQLQRACLAAIGPDSFWFCYDFPASTMLPVYRRLSIEPTNKLTRLAKPLRVDEKIRELVKVPLLAKGASVLANQVLKAKDQMRTGDSLCEVTLHTDVCGEEFTSLASLVGDKNGICTQRSAEYLNWRYRNHYCRRYEFLVARRQERLLAYLVYTRDGEQAEIADLFGVNEPVVLSQLVAEAVERLRKEGVATVSAPILSSHLWLAFFEQLGFHARESCPVVMYSPPQSDAGTVADSSSWLLMQGDRES